MWVVGSVTWRMSSSSSSSSSSVSSFDSTRNALAVWWTNIARTLQILIRKFLELFSLNLKKNLMFSKLNSYSLKSFIDQTESVATGNKTKLLLLAISWGRLRHPQVSLCLVVGGYRFPTSDIQQVLGWLLWIACFDRGLGVYRLWTLATSLLFVLIGISRSESILNSKVFM